MRIIRVFQPDQERQLQALLLLLCSTPPWLPESVWSAGDPDESTGPGEGETVPKTDSVLPGVGRIDAENESA
jgi:hypothetical protein